MTYLLLFGLEFGASVSVENGSCLLGLRFYLRSVSHRPSFKDKLLNRHPVTMPRTGISQGPAGVSAWLDILLVPKSPVRALFYL